MTTSEIGQLFLAFDQALNEHGVCEPQISMHFPAGTRFREVMAGLHTLAAEIELTIREPERWVVNIEPYRLAEGRVYLELAEGTPCEIERAKSVLKNVLHNIRIVGNQIMS